MKEKQKYYYASPQVEAVELTPGGTLLTGSETNANALLGGMNGTIGDFDWE